MLAADRARVPLWDFMAQPVAWREMYRIAAGAESRAQAEIQRRNERRAKMAQMKGRGR